MASIGMVRMVVGTSEGETIRPRPAFRPSGRRPASFIVPGIPPHHRSTSGYHVRAMPSTLLMLPPQRPTTRDWAARLADALPEMSIVVAESDADAARAVGDADASF